MKIDNFKQIKSLMKFESEDDFYFLQILKRKKENPEIPSNHNNNRRAIRTYYINSLDYFNSIEEEIKSLCRTTNSRAYIHLTKRSYKKVGYITLENVAKQLRLGTYNNIYKAYNTACGGLENKNGDKLWVVDIDTKDNNILSKYSGIIKEINNEVIIDYIPTKNGFHIITKGFNVELFKQKCSMYKLPNVDIQKNNPTLLFYEGE